MVGNENALKSKYLILFKDKFRMTYAGPKVQLRSDAGQAPFAMKLAFKVAQFWLALA